MNQSTVSFGLALEAMKQGQKVRRKVWGSQVRSLGLYPGDQYTFPAFKDKRADDEYYWLPRHADLVAEDWEVLA